MAVWLVLFFLLVPVVVAVVPMVVLTTGKKPAQPQGQQSPARKGW